MRGSGRAEHCDKYVEIGCPCSSKFRTWSNAQLLEAVDVATNAAQQCADGHIRPSRLETIQKNLGFRCTSLGLLADPTLRAHVDFMKVLHYDWAHTFLQEGVLGVDAWQLVEATCGARGGVVDPASGGRWWLLPLLPSMLVMGGGPGSREALCVLAGRRLCFPRGELGVSTSGKEKAARPRENFPRSKSQGQRREQVHQGQHERPHGPVWLAAAFRGNALPSRRSNRPAAAPLRYVLQSC